MKDYAGEIVRGIILGTTDYRKCPLCEGTGFQNWDENGNDVKSGRGDLGTEIRSTGECDNCDGLGFILRERDA